jgi:deoxyribodipyrimidine photo-lyase
MQGLDALEFDPRVTRRRIGPPDSGGRCVVYWMQRSQRAFDNPALNLALDVGNLLHKPVVVYFQLVPRSRHANLRHYTFLVQGLRDVAAELKKRGIGFVLWRYPQHGLMKILRSSSPLPGDRR